MGHREKAAKVPNWLCLKQKGLQQRPSFNRHERGNTWHIISQFQTDPINQNLPLIHADSIYSTPPTWRILRKKTQNQCAQRQDLLLAVDCEMVATEDDDNALARVCACDAAGKVLMDRHKGWEAACDIF